MTEDTTDAKFDYQAAGEPYLLYNPPKDAGYWSVCGNLHIHVRDRPNWFHQKMMAYLIGWKWFDA